MIKKFDLNNMELDDLETLKAKSGDAAGQIGDDTGDGESGKAIGWDDMIMTDYKGDAEEVEAGAEAGETSPSVGSLLDGIATDDNQDDRTDKDREPERMTREEWDDHSYYAVTLTADKGENVSVKRGTAIGYDEYLALRESAHEKGYFVTEQDFLTEAEYFPGLLTYDSILNQFETTDESILELKNFPLFSKTAKIRLHDTVVIASKEAGGKSALAINFMNDLIDNCPVLYFNLEMDNLTILQRLISIRTGIDMSQIEQYQSNLEIQTIVQGAARALMTKKRIQAITDVDYIESIEEIIKRTAAANEKTIVIIDHALLVNTKTKSAGRYERFTTISERIRKISRQNNIIMIILMQQNRDGKEENDDWSNGGKLKEPERPKNASLKESGSWENDASKVVFLWWDPKEKCKKLIITKNRSGRAGDEFILDWFPNTQTFRENKNKNQEPEKIVTKYDLKNLPLDPLKKSKRDKERERLRDAYIKAVVLAGERPTIRQIGDADGEWKEKQIRAAVREYGGFTIIQVGKNQSAEDIVSQDEAIELTPEQDKEAGNPYTEQTKVEIIG